MCCHHDRTSIKSNTVAIKRFVCVVISTMICLYILLPKRTIAAEKLSEDFSLIHNNEGNDTNTFHKFGIPADYFQRDFIADNYLVDK